MKHVLVLLWLLLFAFPTLAQSGTLETYEFETGTTLDYPKEWTDELVDDVLVLTGSNQTQVLVLDYPIVTTFVEIGEEISEIDAVELLASSLLDTTIDRDEIYEFTLDDRTVAAYDINLAISGHVYGIKFTNGGIGMLITVEVDEDLETDMLNSFDNSDELVNDVSLPSGRNSEARDVPSVYLFQSNQRFLIPAGWELNVRQRDDIQYATLTAPDDVTVQLFDLSQTLTKGTALNEVLDTVEIDWETDFAFDIVSAASNYNLVDREAISYDLEVDGAEGILIVLRFADDAIGLAVIFGDDVADYEMAINQLVGSFNNLGAVIDFIQ